jgi:hypothetical protein
MAHGADILGTTVQYHVHLLPPNANRNPDETPSAPGLVGAEYGPDTNQ